MADEMQAAPEGGQSEVASTGTAAPSTTDTSAAEAALESRVAQQIAALRAKGLDGDDDGGDAAEGEAPDTEGETPDTEGEGAVDGGNEPAAEAGPEPKGPVLPAAYRRSLKAYGWDDAEIDAAMKADPANFMVAAGKIHRTRSEEIAAWAEQGRAARRSANEGRGAAGAGGRTTEAPTYIDPKTGLYRPIDVDALIERHGNEDLVREIAEPFNAIISQINGILPDLLSGVEQVRESREQNLAQQIDAFFSSKDLAPFAEFYGKDFGTADEKQIENRNKVLEMADALIAGAAAQRRKLSVQDALLAAHDHVSGSFRAAAERKTLKQTVTARAKGVTLRPSGSRGIHGDGPAKTEDELLNRTRQRMAALARR